MKNLCLCCVELLHFHTTNFPTGSTVTTDFQNFLSSLQNAANNKNLEQTLYSLKFV